MLNVTHYGQHRRVAIFDVYDCIVFCGCKMKVLLHDPKEQPLMLQRGFKVSPGFLTQVAVAPTHVSDI